MKKEIMKAVIFCDMCGKEESYSHTCIGCGKQGCYNCRKGAFKEFTHSVCCSGIGDGDFCNNCIENPPEKIIPLLTAYQNIVSLRAEQKEWYANFEKRAKEAEEKIKEERAKLNLY